ncbi:MAG: hypothetical protein K8R86_04925 [Bacteroidales bacterium]|nr:hypothetical protein [Bacteroidales bacterium]
MKNKMENLENITQGDLELQVKDAYCIIKNKQDGFYWVINLEDHPNSFLLDQSFQNFLPSQMKEDQETMVIFQPTI